jgi:class 3 adenylate cyclase
MTQQHTKYARSGDIHIAYQVVGKGPLDLLYVPQVISHIECAWSHPMNARFLKGLSSFARLIIFDRRGTGLSDRAVDLGPIEQQVDDVVAVLRAAESEAAAVFGTYDGGVIASLFAAAHPEQTRALITYATRARYLADVDYPWGRDLERSRRGYEQPREWGTEETTRTQLERYAPTVRDDDDFVRWWANMHRLAASPGVMTALFEMFSQIDVRAVLPAIRVPTLILHRPDDPTHDSGNAVYLSEQIAGARRVALPGRDSLPFVNGDQIVEEMAEFLTGMRVGPGDDRVLATLLFADFVRSTERLAQIGDSSWTGLLDRYELAVRRQLERFRGRLVKNTGDGILAAFDGPARAISCAVALREEALALGLESRSGLHTGEIEVRSDDVAGLAVNIGARVMEMAEAGQILVSRTVKDLIVGSGVGLADKGTHQLKGVPGEWQLYEVRSGG